MLNKEPPGRGLLNTGFGRHVVRPLASLKLTIVLLALGIVLVFCGTLAQNRDDLWTVVTKYFRNFGIVWIPFQIFFPRDVPVGGAFPFPGGWLIGGVLLINLIAAHSVRFKLTWSRSGILLVHAGLIVLLLSELVTGLFAVEGHMTIYVGKSSNYIEQLHAVELAVIDPADPNFNTHTVIPWKMLREEPVIRHEALPFDVQVEKFMVNSVLMKASGDRNPATAGLGKSFTAVSRPEVSGADAEQTENAPSVYVTLRSKSGQDLGTYLVSLWLDNPQPVAVGGKEYLISLRFKRTYRPYTVHLLEFRHDKYLGTDKPKNFSSRVRLVDLERNVDREFLIYMNNPLRYAGETFYQASFKPDDKGTVLQVVRNPGALMPYVSCAMVALGLLTHFLLTLVKFLKRMAA